MHNRHGYPLMFIDRQMLLQALFDNLADKSRVLVRKRVTGINLTSSGVVVTTKDGNSFSTEILP
jgi:hypothetical protein